jgi:hypothetical protein
LGHQNPLPYLRVHDELLLFVAEVESLLDDLRRRLVLLQHYLRGAALDDHLPGAGRGVRVEDVRQEGGELLDLGVEDLDPVLELHALGEREGVSPKET